MGVGVVVSSSVLGLFALTSGPFDVGLPPQSIYRPGISSVRGFLVGLPVASSDSLAPRILIEQRCLGGMSEGSHRQFCPFWDVRCLLNKWVSDDLVR